jgi:hypothetical protein
VVKGFGREEDRRRVVLAHPPAHLSHGKDSRLALGAGSAPRPEWEPNSKDSAAVGRGEFGDKFRAYANGHHSANDEAAAARSAPARPERDRNQHGRPKGLGQQYKNSAPSGPTSDAAPTQPLRTGEPLLLLAANRRAVRPGSCAHASARPPTLSLATARPDGPRPSLRAL